MTGRAAAAACLALLTLLAADPAAAALSPSPSPSVDHSPTPRPSASRTPSPTPPPRSTSPATPSPLPAAPTSLTPAPTTTLPLVVQLVSLDPRIPQPGDTLQLTATVRNASDETMSGLQARLRLGAALCCRSQLADFAAGTDVFGAPLDGTTTRMPGALNPGATTTVRLHVRVDDLALADGLDVYEFGVEVLAGGAAGPATAGILHTFLPWSPPHSVCAPLHLAWVWPVLDQPQPAPARSVPDAGLAAELAPTGRLDTLLRTAAAAAHPPPATRPRRSRRHTAPTGLPVRAVAVSWAVDPMLLSEVEGMAAGTAAGRRAAAGWLSALRAALAGADTIRLPYADPDLVALNRTGLNVGLPFSAAAELAGTLLPGDGLYWPPGGALDRGTALLLLRRHARGLVLDAAALPTATPTSYTPTDQARVSLAGGALPVLLTDTTLDDVVTTGASVPVGARLAEQRFLAETLVMDGERCSTRDVLVAPDRDWSPGAGYAGALLRDTATAPWLRPVTATAQLSGSPDPTPRGPLQYSSASRAAELAAGYLVQVRVLQGSLDQFHLILTAPPRRPADDPLQLAILRTESAAWRARPAGGSAYLAAVQTAVFAERNGVKIDSRGLYTLSSHSGAIPITVENDLGQEVRIAVGFDNVRVSGSAPRIVRPHQVVQIEVRATAKTSGVIPVSVALFTVSHPPQRYSRWVQLRIRSTAYGAVALGITAGALGVLLLAVAVRLFRRAFRPRRGRLPTA